MGAAAVPLPNHVYQYLVPRGNEFTHMGMQARLLATPRHIAHLQ